MWAQIGTKWLFYLLYGRTLSSDIIANSFITVVIVHTDQSQLCDFLLQRLQITTNITHTSQAV